eukprot:jgi/Mesen1/568/ME000107S10804
MQDLVQPGTDLPPFVQAGSQATDFFSISLSSESTSARVLPSLTSTSSRDQPPPGNSRSRDDPDDEGGGETDGLLGKARLQKLEREPLELEAGVLHLGEEGDDGGSLTSWQECKQQLVLAWPIVGMNLLNTLINIVSVLYVGHLGKRELASAAIGSSIVGVTGSATMMGLSGALETLCGQAFGAKQHQMLGVYLQRGLLVMTAVALPIAVLWLNITPVLRALGQEAEIARLAGAYIFYLTPALFAMAWSQALVRFMQAQSVVRPLAACSLLTLLLHIPANYVLIHTLGLGFRGAAVASSLAWWLNLLAMLLYARASGRFDASWGGWSRQACAELGAYLALAAPSWSMLCLEWWCFEATIFLGGLLARPELQVSALSIALNTSALTYMVPFGLSAAASTRISNEIGAGRARLAKQAAQVALALAAVQGVMESCIIFLSRNHLGALFTGSHEVQALVARIMNLEIALVFFDGINGVMSGVLRGSGKQLLGTATNLAAYYVIGLPLAVFLAFHLHREALGLWGGVLTGLIFQSVFLVPAGMCTDWQTLIRKAEASQKESFLEKVSESKDWDTLAGPSTPRDGHPLKEPRDALHWKDEA